MNRSKRTAMILAAGLGTRLGSLTQNRPKALLEVNGRNLLEINLRKLEAWGYTHVVINTHHRHEQIEGFLRTFDTPLHISLSHEAGHPLETGGGILKALPLFGNESEVLVHNVDVITDLPLDILHETLSKIDAAAIVAISDRPSSRRLLFDEHYRLAGWTNTLTGEVRSVRGRTIVYDLAFSAVSCINPLFFKSLAVRRITLIDLLLKLAEHHEVLGALTGCSYWYDLGKAEQIPLIESSLKEKGI